MGARAAFRAAARPCHAKRSDVHPDWRAQVSKKSTEPGGQQCHDRLSRWLQIQGRQLDYNAAGRGGQHARNP